MDGSCDEFLSSSGPRASLDSHFSHNSSRRCSLDLALDACGSIREFDRDGLVREPLPTHHATFLRNTLRKLKPGQQLPARQLHHLGRGGVGEVSLLELDLPDGSILPLARKAIHCRRYDSTRHAREAAAMQLTADCPFVLRVYGTSHPGSKPYALYTEYAPLGSLHDLITRRRRAFAGPSARGAAPYFSEEEVRWLAARVLVALAHCHEQGLAHRDVSPHNIYRSASGHPLLADFDMAAMVDAQGWVYGTAGRLAGAAPEVRAAAYGGGPYGRKADLWSLGMVVLEMVSDEEVQDGPALGGCSEALRSLLLEGLLVTQARRLDAMAAMQHPFFHGVDWERLEYEAAPPGLVGEGLGASDAPV